MHSLFLKVMVNWLIGGNLIVALPAQLDYNQAIKGSHDLIE